MSGGGGPSGVMSGRQETVLTDPSAVIIDIGADNTSWGYAGEEHPRELFASAANLRPKSDGSGGLEWSSVPANFLSYREAYQPLLISNHPNIPDVLKAYREPIFTNTSDPGGLDSGAPGGPGAGVNADSGAPDSGAASGHSISYQGHVNRLVLRRCLGHVRKNVAFAHNLQPQNGFADRAVMMTTPTKRSNAFTERLAELSFEQERVGALSIARKATLSAFAIGRPTALVMEMGPVSTTVCPVFEGYSLYRNARSYHIGGTLVEWLTASAARLYDPGRRAFTSGLEDPFCGCRAASMRDLTKVHPAYLHEARKNVVREIVSACLFVQLVPTTHAPAVRDGQPHPHPHPHQPPAPPHATTYELPDGKQLHLNERAVDTISEYLVRGRSVLARGVGGGGVGGLGSGTAGGEAAGSALGSAPTAEGLSSELRDQLYEIGPWPGLVEALGSCGFSCDLDLVAPLLGNVVVGGGPTALRGLAERLATDLDSRQQLTLSPSGETKSLRGLKMRIAAQASVDRQFTSWIGASIVANISRFDNLWATNAEWQEYGPQLLYSRFIL